MRVALIDTIDKSAGSMPSLSIACLAGYLLEHGHEVRMLDLFHSDRESQDSFFRQDWGLIGISATSFAFPICRQAVVSIRRLNPGVPIVVGGAHASVARGSVLGEKEIDFAIYGEGEISLLELVETLDRDPRAPASRLREIQGLVFRDGHDIVVNPPRARIANVDELPLPPYGIFPMEKYDAYGLWTSRGCPFSCAYCASASILGRHWIVKKPERVVQEVEYLIANWGKRFFNVVDDSFNLKEDRVKEICQLLIDRGLGIQWSACGIRADKTDPEMLRLMKESGCTTVCVGVESADPQVLKNIGKGETINQIAEGIDRIKGTGLRVVGMFMIGNPGDTLATVNGSIDFARSKAMYKSMFYHAIPFPGTALYEFARDNGKRLREDYENFHDFIEEPVFETPDFTYQERVRAYELAKELMFPREPVLSSLVNKTKSMLGLFRWLAHSLLHEGFISLARRVACRLSRRFRVQKSVDDGRIRTRYSRQ